jgi:hypothetical protein
VKIRKRKNVVKRLKERKDAHQGNRREGRTAPGSQNPHKGRGAKK